MEAVHNLTTVDMIGRALHTHEVLLVDSCLRRNLLVRACTCGYLLTGATMSEVQAAYREHAVLVL